MLLPRIALTSIFQMWDAFKYVPEVNLPVSLQEFLTIIFFLWGFEYVFSVFEVCFLVFILFGLSKSKLTMFILSSASSTTENSQVKRGNTGTQEKKNSGISTKNSPKHVLLEERSSPTCIFIPYFPSLPLSLWFVSECERALVNELGCILKDKFSSH